MPQLSAQAKAIATAIVAFLVQLQVYVGQGGIEALTAVTLGQWIAVVLCVFGSYGLVYSVPNTPKSVTLAPATIVTFDPPQTTSAAPFAVTLEPMTAVDVAAPRPADPPL